MSEIRLSEFPPRVLEILKVSSKEYDTTVAIMRSPGIKDRRVTLARVVAASKLLELGFSETMVGRFLGVHHTTVRYYKKLRNEARNAARKRAIEQPPIEIPFPDLSGEWAI